MPKSPNAKTLSHRVSLCPWTLLVDTRRHSRLIISHQTGNTLCVCNFWVSCIFETWLDKPVKTRFETSLEPELTVAHFFTFMKPLFAEEKSPTSESETETLVGHVDPPVQALRCCYSTCVWNPTPSSTTCAQADLQNRTTLHVDSLQFEMSNHLQLLLLPDIAIISAKRHSDIFEDENCDKQELNKVKSLVSLKRYLFVFYLELVTVIPQNIFFLEIRVKAQGGCSYPVRRPFLGCNLPLFSLLLLYILVCY